MSKPKQYSPAFEPGRGSNFNGLEVSMREDLAGKWVLHSDYAALAAENERLRKIGFEMRKMIGDHAWTLAWDAECKYSPYAAKEGGDAK